MRFRIRDVLWLTVMVAFATAWLIERRQVGRLTVELERQKASYQRELAVERFRRQWEAKTIETTAWLKGKGIPVTKGESLKTPADN